MKTKLLKKIRERFEIHRCDELRSDAGENELKYAREFGLPFYYITDDKVDNSYFPWYCHGERAFPSYKEALSGLINIVHYKYFELIKHKDAKTTKVWSVNNKKTK